MNETSRIGELLAEELGRFGQSFGLGLLLWFGLVAGGALFLAWLGRRALRVAWRLGADRARNLARVAILFEAVLVCSALALALRPLGTALPILTAGALAATGLVVALAMPRRVENVVAGLSVAVFGRHRVGDQIETQGIRGSVRDLGLTRTRLRIDDGSEVWLPNALLEADAVKVARSTGAAPVRVRFEVSPDRRERVLAEVMQAATLSPYRRVGSKPRITPVDDEDTAFALEVQTWATRELDVVRRSLAASVAQVVGDERQRRA